MSIQDKKIELIQWLATVDDPSVLDRIMELREKEKADWWKELSEEEKKSIEKGTEEANSGKLESHSEARKLYERWL